MEKGTQATEYRQLPVQISRKPAEKNEGRHGYSLR
jgi:hypothetical protein